MPQLVLMKHPECTMRRVSSKTYLVRASLLLTAGFEGIGPPVADFASAEDVFPGPVNRDDVSVEEVELVGPQVEHPELEPITAAGAPMADEDVEAVREELVAAAKEAMGYSAEQMANYDVLLTVRGQAIVAVETDTPDDIAPEDAWEALPSTIDVADINATVGVAEWT